MMECINEILGDMKLYNSPTFAVSISQMIHKGKGKPLDKHNSYQRISVGPKPQKIIDAYMSKDTGDIAKKAQPNMQFGFTENKNYLEATVLRTFTRTDRVSQLSRRTWHVLGILLLDL